MTLRITPRRCSLTRLRLGLNVHASLSGEARTYPGNAWVGRDQPTPRADCMSAMIRVALARGSGAAVIGRPTTR